MRRARDLMDREYAEPLDVPATVRAALMSPSHFARQFPAAYGETPYSYLMTRHIERAKALLRCSDRTVTEACMAFRPRWPCRSWWPASSCSCWRFGGSSSGIERPSHSQVEHWLE